MKKICYHILMIILSVICSFFLYLSTLTILARYRIIPLHSLDSTLGMLMSPVAYSGVLLFAIICGYYMAKKWWQIIYIDGVYYFDKSKIPTVAAPLRSRRRVIKK